MKQCSYQHEDETAEILRNLCFMFSIKDKEKGGGGVGGQGRMDVDKVT